VQRVVEDAFSEAAVTYVQLEEAPTRAVIECEAVARLRSTPSEPLHLVQPAELERSPNYSHVALVGSPNLLFTSEHVARKPDEQSARGAFEALQRSLEEAGASIRRVAMSNLYPSSPKAADMINRTRFDFYDRDNPPGSTLMIYEGLPDKSFFAVDVVAPIE
jgi:enamine deaminase RidA (YjgF/YER057c/UK114 family)